MYFFNNWLVIWLNPWFSLNFGLVSKTFINWLFFQKFPKSNLGFAWNCKFFKNSACKPWFWALCNKKLLEFDLFSYPPWILPAKQGFKAVLYINFLPKSWNFPKIFFCPLENQRFLAKSLENFAWKRWKLQIFQKFCL